MLDLLVRLFASAAGLVAVAFGIQLTSASSPSGGVPRDSLQALQIAPGLAATLVAEAPTITNPTNIDVDSRGRIWLLEGFNYRKFKPKPLRAAGDRVVILEDTTGDGVADKSTVFYQGTDIDAAMGIVVLGNRVIVSAYTKIFVFTDTDGDDKPDKKEILFTGGGPSDHDHSTHAFVFGPDGRLYFNGGNETRSLMDPAGNVLVDRAGYRVEAKRDPYQEGMSFRLEPDATKFEVLGYNFRNPYELALDSYGTVWQTDNDDDGNRSTRLNYVMEGGNFGYRDEMTGAGWSARRTNMEPEIPRRHWHSGDPGSVPNVRINGAGSPSGLTVYEGTLLPKQFQGALIHADPGPNEVRAFTVAPDGAGYSAERIPLITTQTDKMFRPVDVAVAPDGSLFVADWYDAGVGGHNMSDQSQGRIIRIAPPGMRYTVPKLDLSSPAAATRALRSPNLATRQLAYEKLAGYGRRAEGVLVPMFRGTVPHDRARALWLLARITGRGARYLAEASRDADPNIRITALRATRRVDGDVIAMAERLVRDPSPAVRREVAIALRHNESRRAGELWAGLAQQYDGRDRWYLEALGVAGDRQWDRYFGAWLDRIGDEWNTPAGRDIVWRARSARALPLLEKLIADPATPATDRLRYLRALDFHPAEARQKSLLALLATPVGASAEITPVILSQLDAKAVGSDPAVQAALQRTLASMRGTTQWVDLVERYGVRTELDELVRLAVAKPNETMGSEAARLALAWGGAPKFAALVRGTDDASARRGLVVLGRNFTPAVDTLMTGVVLDSSRALDLRRMAVQSIGTGYNGWIRLISLARDKKLPKQLEPAASAALFAAWPEIRDSAAKYLTPPPATTLDGKTLPPLTTLAARTGEAAAGRAVFERSCTACHVVGGTGTDFGPALTEIGDKLPKSGLLLAILDPSAGIGFGYEGWTVKTRDGQQLVGMITSETDDEVAMKLIGGIQRRVPKSTILDRKRMETSLMPQGLERTMSETDLVNLVEYLSTLHRQR